MTLTLARPLAHDDTVTIAYTKPTDGAVIEDLAGNAAATFADQSVINNSAVPRVGIEAVYADATPGFAPAEFVVTRSNASVYPLMVTLTLVQHDGTSNDQTITIPPGSISATAKLRRY